MQAKAQPEASPLEPGRGRLKIFLGATPGAGQASQAGQSGAGQGTCHTPQRQPSFRAAQEVAGHGRQISRAPHRTRGPGPAAPRGIGRPARARR